jgi:hypothetical protein
MMKAIDPYFVQFDLKIESTDVNTAMAGSVIKTNDTLAESQAQGGEKIDGIDNNRNNDRSTKQRRGYNQNAFFTLNERDFKGLVKSNQNEQASDFRSKHSAYGKMGTK